MRFAIQRFFYLFIPCAKTKKVVGVGPKEPMAMGKFDFSATGTIIGKKGEIPCAVIINP